MTDFKDLESFLRSFYKSLILRVFLEIPPKENPKLENIKGLKEDLKIFLKSYLALSPKKHIDCFSLFNIYLKTPKYTPENNFSKESVIFEDFNRCLKDIQNEGEIIDFILDLEEEFSSGLTIKEITEKVMKLYSNITLNEFDKIKTKNKESKIPIDRHTFYREIYRLSNEGPEIERKKANGQEIPKQFLFSNKGYLPPKRDGEGKVTSSTRRHDIKYSLIPEMREEAQKHHDTFFKLASLVLNDFKI